MKLTYGKNMFKRVKTSRSSDTSSEKNYWSIGGAKIRKRDYQIKITETPILGQNQTFFGLMTATGEIFTDSFVSDPFVVENHDTSYMFFEICGYLGSKYVTAIAVTTLNKFNLDFGNVHILKVAKDKQGVNRTFTISYPYPIVVEKEIYLLLEEYSVESKTYVYRFDTQSFTIKPVNSVNARLLDPNIQYCQDNYWIYGVDKDYSIRVFYSDSLFNAFEEHRNTRKYKSKRFARNAGSVFSFQDQLIRPFQDCSVDYGRSLAFSEITLEPKKGLEIVNLGALDSLTVSGQDTHPYWATSKCHHFAFMGENNEEIFGLIDGARRLRITNHGWISAH